MVGSAKGGGKNESQGELGFWLSPEFCVTWNRPPPLSGPQSSRDRIMMLSKVPSHFNI